MDVNPYLEMMVRYKASDLFFNPGAPVKIKIEGIIRPIGESILTPELCQSALASIMDSQQAQEFEQERELDFAIALEDRARFRVNAYYQRGNTSMVLRYIRANIPTLEELNLPPLLSQIIMRKRGIILMVGATGSGKSTTLAAMLDYRNSTASGHIITIEDPIEFVHPHKQCIISQREIGVDTKSYAKALKSVLREAPDVILIGEIRTRETMEAAIELAGTGHLAVSTLHANNAHQALKRVINMFPSEMHNTLFMDLSIYLQAILSQRLVKTKTGSRCAAIEALVNTPHISDLIREGRVDAVIEAMQQSGHEGIQTFDDALLLLYRDGLISLEEALANADSAPNLEAKVHFS
ncbi:PilT/PilU family type 4a pilus ATPase [Chromatium okenii]|uniref:Type IV pili twitching motility protein PilT n=1 Tax=Chromatium okenii TaxID=61644 RepID=A0A2S7XTI7_9GAMM|nr:PilT/PilU family type 4a pilus ATPase [Chromatium okenii]MBV5308504.1 PilT/PilU family type 4a pilus ATPase [Chromatium okenii]PQJ96741.1 type IV pili twitching motility protein PilT [Chromatium okenii]